MVRLGNANETGRTRPAGHPIDRCIGRSAQCAASAEKHVHLRRHGDQGACRLALRQVRDRSTVGGVYLGRFWERSGAVIAFLRTARHLWTADTPSTLETAGLAPVDSTLAVESALRNAAKDQERKAHAFTHLSRLPQSSAFTQVTSSAGFVTRRRSSDGKLKAAASQAVVDSSGTIATSTASASSRPCLHAERGLG
jgi:hypothetical protein